MTKALVALIDDNFIIAYEVFIKSLLKHNPWFDHTIVFLDCGLSNDSKKKILSKYKKVKFEHVRIENYRSINMAKTAKHLRKTYYTFEAFRLPYDRIVFMDMDLLITGDISEIFDCDKPIAGCKTYSPHQDCLTGTINTGVFVINHQLINMATCKRLIRYCRNGYSMPDQHGINRFFRNQISYLPKKYNVEKRMYKATRDEMKKILEDVRVIHYVAKKPWQKSNAPIDQGFEEVEKLWWDCYNDNM